MSTPSGSRVIVQISLAATNHLINGGHNYILAALCNDGSVFIASPANDWLAMKPIPQPPPPAEESESVEVVLPKKIYLPEKD